MALNGLWQLYSRSPSGALFGPDFASFTEPDFPARFDPTIIQLLNDFIQPTGPRVRIASLDEGWLPYGCLYAIAADIIGSPVHLKAELQRQPSNLATVVRLFDEERQQSFQYEADKPLILVGADDRDYVQYYGLLDKNYSHFAGDNLLFYLSYHHQAVWHARAAANSPSPRKERQFLWALLTEAFAGHFLADMFSSAHARVPRWAFIN
jgi:hypothetical protein